MQQVGDTWRQLTEEEQLQFSNWEFINGLQLQMGLDPLDNPEALKPEDEDEEMETEANQACPRNPPTQSIAKGDAAMPISKKSNFEAESACNKWVTKAVTDVSSFLACSSYQLIFFDKSNFCSSITSVPLIGLRVFFCSARPI